MKNVKVIQSKAKASKQTADPVIARPRFTSENDGTEVPQVDTWRKPVYRNMLAMPMFFTRKCITLRQ